MTKQKPRLKVKYEKEIVPALMKEMGVKNKLAVPRITKVVVNAGVGDAVKNKELMKQVKNDLAAVCGQMPAVRQAKVSVASFSVREGMPVGLKSTLRDDKKYDFLDKLISVVLPRLRDFRGVSVKSFDKQGNYSLGIEEHIVFPEIDMTKSSPRGLQVTIVTNAKEKKWAVRLLELIGMPFEKDDST